MKKILKPNHAVVGRWDFFRGTFSSKNQALHFGLSQDAQPITMKEPPVSALGEVTIPKGGEAASQITYRCGNCNKLLLVLSEHLTHLVH